MSQLGQHIISLKKAAGNIRCHLFQCRISLFIVKFYIFTKVLSHFPGRNCELKLLRFFDHCVFLTLLVFVLFSRGTLP